MSIMGVPEAAVYGNASEVPDSESGEEGVHADVQYPNETLEEVIVDAEAQGLEPGAAAAQGQVRDEAEGGG